MYRISTTFFLLIAFSVAFACASCGNSGIPELDKTDAALYQNAKLLYLSADYVKAEKSFREISVKQPDFFQARFMLGKALFALGRHAEAETCFFELVSRYPQYHEASIWLARTELLLNKLESAEKRLKNLMAFDSNDPRILSLYAKLCKLKKDHTTAIQYYSLSTQFEYDLALDHLELARYYHEFGLKEKALLEIDKCLLLIPANNALYNSVKALKTAIDKMEPSK
ncbi:MAG: hypothetical protein EHM28_08180 [Spirochaetaceae bacterium]|nr:MAG: hypothetical protein EHM28_08180 [Spirochaetaceae bacterium]